MNSSGDSSGIAARAAGLPALTLSALAIVCAPASSADREAIDDAAARLQYAYYTADARALSATLDALAAESPAAERSYYLAYGYWRLAELRDAEGRGVPFLGPSEELRRCTRHAQETLALAPQFAEAQALVGVCNLWFAREGSRCRMRDVEAAKRAALDNPRIHFIALLCHDAARDPQLMREVAAAFDTAAERTTAPDWGHAEAYMLLGAALLKRGDPIAAREALERAVAIAPDYKAAQELLAQVSARAR